MALDQTSLLVLGSALALTLDGVLEAGVLAAISKELQA